MLGLAIVALVALGGVVLATAPSEPSLPGAEQAGPRAPEPPPEATTFPEPETDVEHEPTPDAAQTPEREPDATAEADRGEAPPAMDADASSAMPLPADVRAAMTGVSWHQGCPVALDDLTLLELRHWGFDGQVHTGQLVIATRVADEVSEAFEALFAAGFPIERMELIDVYDGDDDASMAANNTSAFNCRAVEGSDRWSEHALGTAIDINPVQNPYLRDGRISPNAGTAYLDRDDVRPGMIVRPGPVVDAFIAIGWGWGGDWRSVKDYHHFSAAGR